MNGANIKSENLITLIFFFSSWILMHMETLITTNSTVLRLLPSHMTSFLSVLYPCSSIGVEPGGRGYTYTRTLPWVSVLLVVVLLLLPRGYNGYRLLPVREIASILHL